MTLVLLKGLSLNLNFRLKDKKPNFLFSKTSTNFLKFLSQASVFFSSYLYSTVLSEQQLYKCLWNPLATH